MSKNILKETDVLCYSTQEKDNKTVQTLSEALRVTPGWLVNFVNVDEIGLYVVVNFFGGLIEMAGRLEYYV